MINAIHFYRIARWLYLHKVPLFPKIIQFFIFLLYNTKITPKTPIGKGTYLICGGISTVIHDETIIGENCRLGIHLTIVGQGPYKNVAKIGNNVWIGPNVTIQGPVIIDDNVIIAPNSVVNKSIPRYSIVAGVPAKIIGDVRNLDYDIFKNEAWKEGTKEYMNFN